MSLPALLTQHIARRPQRIALLQHVAEQGSITRAAKAAGVSYKAAWDAIDELNNLAAQPLVERSTGAGAVVAPGCPPKANGYCACTSACKRCRQRSWSPPRTATTSLCSAG